MEVIEYVGKIDDRMNRINKNYKYIGENIHNYINDGKIEYEQLMDFELSLQNLSIELNKLVYVFNQFDNNETNVNNENPNIINTILQLSNNINQNKYNNKINNVNQENQENQVNQVKQVNQVNKMDKIDYALDKTIFHFLPLLFMYFMIFDNESILYIKDFIGKQDNTNNYTNNSNTFTPTHKPTKEEIIDDLD